MFAARVGDMHVCPMVTPTPIPVPHAGGPIMMPIIGKPVLIGNMPAAGAGCMCMCVGPPDVITPACAKNKVLVNGTPLARMGDITAHGGSILMGCPTVLIGAGAISPSAITSMASQAQAAAAEVGAQAAEVMDQVADANDEINALLEKGDLSEAEQTRLDELNESYGDSIEDIGMNDDDFEDWT